MNRITHRLQVFEIDDQPWFSPILRSRVQTVLTGLWTAWLPPLQRTSPAFQTAQILVHTFGERIRDYTVVDFCSGAGGPTPEIERVLNDRLLSEFNVEKDAKVVRPVDEATDATGSGLQADSDSNLRKRGGGECQVESEHVLDSADDHESRERHTKSRERHTKAGVDFIMTDLAPHPTSWASLSASRKHLHYIATPVDATRAPSAESLLALSSLNHHAEHESGQQKTTKILRTFHLSFHHFDDPLAKAILRNTFETADAIVITELIERTFSSLLMEALMLVPIAVFTPYWAWVGRSSGYRNPKPKTFGKSRGSATVEAREDWGIILGIDWVLLLFTYFIPIIPFVVVFDGWMSSLRCRTGDEVMQLVNAMEIQRDNERGRRSAGAQWVWKTGRECHTWPFGFTTYFVGVKAAQNDGL